MGNDNIGNFSVTVYGDLEKYNEVISKARCRIFYKYGNRNGTYITDEFAETLLSSIPYAPVKGIYDNYEEDYSDHGARRSFGRIYGIVPERPNLAWEKHLDEDGVEREYACVDVLIFTGLYEEANQIVGKAQSMELYQKSITGEWQFIDGSRYYVFKTGCFLGLQVLGEEVEPCFEGASFFSLATSIKQLLSDYELYVEKINNQGGKEMDKLNFNLPDSTKFDKIWSLLNTNFTEESGMLIDYSICDIFDDYAIVKNHQQNIFEKVGYKDQDMFCLDGNTQCYVVYVTESEKNALEALREANNGTYEKIDENYSAAVQKNSQYEQKIGELNGSISTLSTDKEEMQGKLNTANENLSAANEKISAMQSEYNTLKEENDALAYFKSGVEKNEKMGIIDSYSDKLSSEIIEKFTAAIDSYKADDLKKELAYELVESNPSLFIKTPQSGYVPTDSPKGGIEEILSKYKK